MLKLASDYCGKRDFVLDNMFISDVGCVELVRACNTVRW